MKTYSVKEIAEMLQVNPETVRRWIKNDRLKAEALHSNKEGHVVTEQMLKRFLRDNPKYAGTAALAGVLAGGAAAGLSGGVLPVIGGASLLAASLLASRSRKDTRITGAELIGILRSDIDRRMKAVAGKEEAVRQLEDEIEQERKMIAETEKLLMELENASDLFAED